jgi:hypothetical protein
MNKHISINSTSKPMLWAGRILSALVALFLLLDGTIKVMELDVATKTTAELGYPVSVVFGLGILTLVIAALYAIPRTSVLGAILLTGLLGGAITTHLRVGNPIFTHMLFGLYVGLAAWGGLVLRNERLRALILPWATSRRS